MKHFLKPLLLIVGLFVAAAGMAAIPDDVTEPNPIAVEFLIDVENPVIVNLVEFEKITIADGCEIDMPANPVNHGTEIETPVWKDPRRLDLIIREAKRKTDLKLKEQEDKLKSQIFSPLRQ